MAHGDVDADVLDATVRRLSGVPRGNALARAERQALSHLWGLPVIRDLGEVTAEEVVAEARAAVPTVLVLGERAEDGGADLRLVQGPNPVPPGEVRSRFRSRRRAEGVLTLSEHTCEVTAGEARQVVSWHDLVAVQHRGPTRRVLVPRYGLALIVDAARWRDGGRAVAAVDALVPTELVVTAPALARSGSATSGATRVRHFFSACRRSIDGTAGTAAGRAAVGTDRSRHHRRRTGPPRRGLGARPEPDAAAAARRPSPGRRGGGRWSSCCWSSSSPCWSVSASAPRTRSGPRPSCR